MEGGSRGVVQGGSGGKERGGLLDLGTGQQGVVGRARVQREGKGRGEGGLLDLGQALDTRGYQVRWESRQGRGGGREGGERGGAR